MWQHTGNEGKRKEINDEGEKEIMKQRERIKTGTLILLRCRACFLTSVLKWQINPNQVTT
jgi:hypothetical protein